MEQRKVLVIGATGDVGRGIVGAVLAKGWVAVAAGRSRGRLAEAFPPRDGLILVEGSLDSEASTAALWDAASAAAGPIDAVVVSVNAPTRLAPLEAWSDRDFADLLSANIVTHFNAVKVLRRLLPDHGLLVGIGGGTADFIIPTNAAVSVAQAGLRMMYRGFARERQGGAGLRELMIVSMVNGVSKREQARPEWVTDEDVGRHVCAVIATPDQFPGPILQLRSREQVGQPDSPEGSTKS